MEKPTFFVVSHSTLHINPRELRQLEALRQRGHVWVWGLTDPGIEGVNYIPIQKKDFTGPLGITPQIFLLLSGQYERYITQRYVSTKLMPSIKPSLVCAHNIQTMPRAVAMAQGSPILLDLHEYHPRELETQWAWRLCIKSNVTRMCRRWLSKATVRYTVGQRIAQEYVNAFGLPCDVLFSASPYETISPSPVRDGNIRLAHHGVPNPNRKLENLILLMNHLDSRFELHLTIVGDGPYAKHLRHLSEQNPRIYWHSPVSTNEVATYVSQYDLALIMFPSGDFNLDYSLPNKFFESVQGRLGFAVSPSPEMAALVHQYDMGVVASDDSIAAMAVALNSLHPKDIMRFKNNANRAALELCAEREKKKFTAMVDAALGEAR